MASPRRAPSCRAPCRSREDEKVPQGFPGVDAWGVLLLGRIPWAVCAGPVVGMSGLETQLLRLLWHKSVIKNRSRLISPLGKSGHCRGPKACRPACSISAFTRSRTKHFKYNSLPLPLPCYPSTGWSEQAAETRAPRIAPWSEDFSPFLQRACPAEPKSVCLPAFLLPIYQTDAADNKNRPVTCCHTPAQSHHWEGAASAGSESSAGQELFQLIFLSLFLILWEKKKK